MFRLVPSATEAGLTDRDRLRLGELVAEVWAAATDLGAARRKAEAALAAFGEAPPAAAGEEGERPFASSGGASGGRTSRRISPSALRPPSSAADSSKM